MKVYSYKNIKCITGLGITFMDGYNIVFEECRKEWSKAKKIDITESHCVAERDLLAKEPYFLFYSKDRVKIICNSSNVITNEPKKMPPCFGCPARNARRKIQVFHRRMKSSRLPCQSYSAAPGL